MVDPWKLAELHDARAWRNFENLQSARGHMMNAIFALESGTKAEAIRILNAGLDLTAASSARADAPSPDAAEAGVGRELGL